MSGFEMDDDAEVWEAARGGDSDAFGRIFERHRDRVYHQALRLTRSYHDAEDVTALVFLEAWRRRAHVRVVDGSIIGWLLVTANYVSRNHARALRRHHVAMATLPPPGPTEDFSPDVDARLDSGGRRAAARKAFAGLSPKDQDVVTLCVIQEMTIADAAVALGIPQGTVKSRLSRAKQRLAAVLSDLSDPWTTSSSSTPGGAS